MTMFVQLHLLTPYPPSNPNRDDQGRPKSAVVGGHPRLRLSSQSIKRAVRKSAFFEHDLAGNRGTRTKRIAEELFKKLTAEGVPADRAMKAAADTAVIFSKLEEPKENTAPLTTTLAFVSPDEWALAAEIARKMVAGEKLPTEKDLKKLVLRKADGAVDIAMFGRMLADDPNYNREAAVQVAHAITTHRAVVENDYYTAVDDLKKPAEDAGAGFVGEAGFGAGVFYLYACIDRDLLRCNLGGDVELAATGIKALIEAAATVSPKGKQASFASRARASYVLVEKGDTAPRTLAAAFSKPIGGDDLLRGSIKALQACRGQFARAYGDRTETCELDLIADQGTLADVVAFASA